MKFLALPLVSRAIIFIKFDAYKSHPNRQKGSSINYVSTFEGGGGTKMLMVADARGRWVSEMLTSANFGPKQIENCRFNKLL